jgi:transcriptional regulator with XRE-family HTH domain
MPSSGDMLQVKKQTSLDVCMSVASRVKSRRLELNLTQVGLAARAGVNIETYRKFERTGEVSFQNLVKLALALDMTSDFDRLFAQKQYQSLDDLLTSEQTNRQRGQRR